MIWLYIGWLIVLIGAEVGYFHQYPRSYIEARVRHRALYREWLTLAVVGEVTRRFWPASRPDGSPRWAVRSARRSPTCSVDDLVARGILVRGAEPEGLVFSVAPERITVLEVLEVVRDPGAVDESVVASGAGIGASVLRRRDAAVREALGGMRLRDLVETRGGEAAVVTELARYRAGAETSGD